MAVENGFALRYEPSGELGEKIKDSRLSGIVPRLGLVCF